MKKPIKKTGSANETGKKKPGVKPSGNDDKHLTKYKKQSLHNPEEEEEDYEEPESDDDLSFDVDEFDDFEEEDEDY